MVIAVAFVLLVLGVRLMTPHAVAPRTARALAHALTVQRWHAVTSGDPVVLRFDDNAGPYIARIGSFGCERDPTLQLKSLLVPPASVLIGWPSGAIAFDHAGRPRSCTGGGVGNTTIDIIDRNGHQAAVIVAALGRVRWERR